MSEKSEDLLRNVAKSLTNERFKLILFPTEQCNFRCLYCYENYQLPKMSNETVEGIKLFLDKRIPTLKLFELEWFGGEPLLEKKIVIEITKHVKLLCEKHDVVFHSIMTTNGYLLDIETFKELNRIGIKSYQITFDGDRKNHNQFRLLANSKIGSFDKIWNNLLKIKNHSETDFVMTIRCHLTSINKASVQSLLRRIKDAFSEDKRFFIHLKEISALGGQDDDKIQHISREMKHIVVEELKNEYKELSFVDIGKDYVCYAAKPNCFLIRADGTIGKCTVALDSEINNVGKLLEDGTIKIEKEKYLSWFQGFENLDKEILDCPYYALKRKGEF
ncbi:MAG: radical SAM protein [Lentimicrobiaceae bacterium]|nr:radical SAM protein [Lentimicrobiaceae bacterium]